MRWAANRENVGHPANDPMAGIWVLVLEDILIHSDGGVSHSARHRGGVEPS